jgi:hypothetical protein
METKEIVYIVVGITLFIFLTVLGANAMAKKSCIMSYEKYQPQYTFYTGCRIMVEDRLTPVEIVRELK